MCEAWMAIFRQQKRAHNGRGWAPLKFGIFEAFSCNVVQSGAIISQQNMMDFYRLFFYFKGCGAVVFVGVQEAHNLRLHSRSLPI